MTAFSHWPQLARLRRVGFMLAALVVFVPACRVTDLPLWGLPSVPADAYEVARVRGVRYFDGPEADPVRHRVDLFLPKGKKNFPVVVLVHGGAWIMGDNRCCGLHSSVGEFLASRGIGAVLPNYRLSPSVKHPEHIRDVARAFAWTHAHIADYGGCPERMFLLGHSAGGHLVSLLATDEQYLKAEGRTLSDIRGVIAVSGVYRIPCGKVDVTLGGQTAQAFRWDKMLPLRRASSPSPVDLPGIPLSLNVFGPAFGDNAKARQDASPIHHVRAGLPPFLLFIADNDLPTLPEMAREFHQELRKHNVEAHLFEVENRNHNSILFSAIDSCDPVGGTILHFIARHTASTTRIPAAHSGKN